MTAPLSPDVLEDLITGTIAPAAPDVDAEGRFPRDSIDALLAAGYGALTSSPDVGGVGASFADAAAVVRRLAAVCGSTAMIYTMHLAATAAIEAAGSDEVRRQIAAGRHLSTLAFSERGSRSHFWATLSTARAEGDDVVLDAEKSWVTSAGEADSYVWTSRPVEADGPSTLWLVPADAPGLKVGAPFDGLGLRGNASSPVAAVGARIGRSAMLGADGGGLDLALSQVLPWFLVLNAAGGLGFGDAALAATLDHLTSARLEHLDQTLADQAVPRARYGRLRVVLDSAGALVDDACVALGSGRPDAPLRMLEVKAAAGEAAIEVTSEAMRLGGGAAFRRDIGVERHFRDARASSVMAPTSDALHDMITRALTGMPLL
ncbi:MAG: acyl-CoA dehydrogenase family protein [Acidimicrobiales bacterium]